MENCETERYRFEEFLVDTDTRTVLRDGKEVHVPELSFDVLVALLRHAPSVVSKKQLMSEVWTDVIVEPDTVNKRITMLRESLAEAGCSTPVIRVVRGRGYSINVPVEQVDDEPWNEPPESRQGSKVLGLISIILILVFGIYMIMLRPGDSLEKDTTAPSLAVLPFQLASNQVAPFFGELSNDLLRYLEDSGGILIASADAIEAIPKGSELPDIARRLGVHYVVTGNLELVDSNLKLTIQLFDSEDVNESWTEDFHKVQIQEVIYAIANSILHRIGVNAPELSRSFTNPEAYQLYLRANQHAAATELSDEAEQLYRQAIEIDGRFAPALAGLCRLYLIKYGVTRNITDFQEAEQYCFRAWTIDAQSIEVKRSLALLYRHSGQISKERDMYKEALALNPYDYSTKVSLAQTYVEEDPSFAESILKQLIQQHPGSPFAHGSLQYLYFNQGRYSEAVEQGRWAVKLESDSELYKLNLTGNLMFAGKLSEAKSILLEMLEIDSGKSGHIQNQLGFIYFFEGDFEKASSLFKAGVKRGPDNPSYNRNLGDAIWHSMGKKTADPIFRKVIRLSKQHLEINPTDYDHISCLMVAYGSVGELDNFLDTKGVLLKVPGGDSDPQSHYDIAIAASRLKQMPLARLHAKKAHDLGYPLVLLKADPDIAASGVSFE